MMQGAIARALWLLGVVAFVATAEVTAQRAPRTAGSGARQTVATLLREAEALGVRTGMVVLDVAGATLVAHRSGEVFVPASNQKLLTAVAALNGLGAAYEFDTAFRLEAGVLRVTGSGDPNWTSGGAHDSAQVFAALARRLREAGVRAVRGVELVAGAFSGPLRPRGWPADQLQFHYCPPTGALVLDGGCFRVRVRTEAAVARLQVLRPAGLPIQGSVRVARRGAPFGVREANGVLVAGGRVSPGTDKEVAATVQDPGLVFRRAVEAALDRGGIQRRPDAPARDLAVGVHRSSLVEALRPMLVDSSNFHAEQVLRALGAELAADGSFRGGTRELRRQLASLTDLGVAGLVVVDGSGLSRLNRVSPRLIASALAAALRQPYAALLRDLMAQPGQGSLRKRFRGSAVRGQVYAKSGWISGASSLSGVVGDRVFSILMNYDSGRGGLNARLKQLQERLVEAVPGLVGK